MFAHLRRSEAITQPLTRNLHPSVHKSPGDIGRNFALRKGGTRLVMFIDQHIAGLEHRHHHHTSALSFLGTFLHVVLREKSFDVRVEDVQVGHSEKRLALRGCRFLRLA